MSDCSMQAMKSKEPKVLCTGCAETRKRERIAQVAREMLELLEATIDPSCEERCPVYAFLPGQDNCIKQFREQLEECGVSVDD